MREGTFLGYKVNAEELKVCPNKVEVVHSLPSLKCLKDVQRLNGKLASLNRFLSKSAEKSLPFFKTLKKCRKKSDFQWTTEAKMALMRHCVVKPKTNAKGRFQSDRLARFSVSNLRDSLPCLKLSFGSPIYRVWKIVDMPYRAMWDMAYWGFLRARIRHIILDGYDVISEVKECPRNAQANQVSNGDKCFMHSVRRTLSQYVLYALSQYVLYALSQYVLYALSQYVLYALSQFGKMRPSYVLVEA
ncbi:hypothetical protein Tco_0828381 [Tanacetum coccineum]